MRTGTLFLSTLAAVILISSAVRAESDGLADRIAVMANGAGTLVWRINRTLPNGWGPAHEIDAEGLYGTYLQVPLLGDANGDGVADRVLVADDPVAGALRWEVDFSLADGTGWGDGQTDLVGHFGPLGGKPVALADVDGDGRADRVVVAAAGQNLSWSWDHNGFPADFGTGAGSQLDPQKALFGDLMDAPIGVADVDGDGHADRVLNTHVGVDAAPRWDINLTDANAPNGTAGLTLGDWGPSPAADSDSYGLPDYQPLVGDVDGDGRADRVLVHGIVWEADLTDGPGGADRLWGDGTPDTGLIDNPFGIVRNTFLLGDVLGTGPLLFGDVNLDGEVNGMDVGPFTHRLLNGVYQLQADMNNDHVINGLDASLFAAAVFGQESRTEPTPEPATLALAVLGLAGLLFGFRGPGREPR